MSVSPLTFSFGQIAAPVALILLAGGMVILAAMGIVPMTNPPLVFEPPFRIFLIVLGIAVLSLGSFFFWHEMQNRGHPTVQLTAKDTHTLADEIGKRLRTELPCQTQTVPYSQSLFDERREHFRKEKEHLAKCFSTPLLLRCRKYAESGRQVHLIIDSGTTISPLFEKLGEATARAARNEEKWIGRLLILTNSIPGVESLMRSGRIDPTSRYSSLAVNCDLLPGVPLPVYSAITGERTVAALRKFREEAGTNAIFITLTTGNWIRLRRSAPVCPIPLARGRGHLEFKQALIDYSDEIFVMTPLGKIFVEIPPGDVNKALGFDEKYPELDKKPYHEVTISDEKAAIVKMISTCRGTGYVLTQHSTRVRALLGDDTKRLADNLRLFPETPIANLAHLIFPFDDLPPERPAQIDIEFPHPDTRGENFMQEFFLVSPVPAQKQSKGRRG